MSGRPKSGEDSPGPVAERCRRVGRALGWEWPWFLLPLSRAWFVEDESVGTLGVSAAGEIRVAPSYLAKLDDRAVATRVAHELLHPMLRHHLRVGDRDAEEWNVAADRSLNQVLREMGILDPSKEPEALLPVPGQETWAAEDIYDAAHDGDKPPKSPGQRPRPMAGCGVEGDQPGDGQGEGDSDGEGEGSTSGGDDLDPETAREWREIAVQAASLAAGKRGGQALARVLLPPPSKVDWRRVLRATVARAVAAHGRDEQSFSRRSRRSTPEVILPGWKSSKATAAVIIDSSGSVSDEALAEMASETAKIARESGARIFLVVHDAVVQHAGWIEAKHPYQVQGRITGRGGTVFQPAYDAVEQLAGRRVDAGIHLTDGFGEGWPKRPRNVRKMTIALWGKGPGSKPDDADVIEVSQ